MPSPPTTATLNMLERVFMPDFPAKWIQGRSLRSAAWKALISSSRRNVSATSSNPSSRPARRRGSISKRCVLPVGEVMVCASRSMPIRPAPCVSSTSAARPSTISLSTTIGRMPFWKAIGEEDVAEARTDHGADAAFLQRPHRAFARGAAAEIRPGDQDLRLAIGLAVEDEFRIFRTVGQIAQRAERPFAERAADAVADQPLDADDHVGIDIGAHDRSCDRAQFV